MLFGCRKKPEIPEPATPKGLSYQIQDGNILFSWFPAEDALSYGMEIATDAELANLVFTREGITDAFQLVSCDSFVADSTYYWWVRAEGEACWGDWSEIVSFTYGVQLDLDTTYFPFGLGYEWCYESREAGREDGESWDKTSFFTVRIIDSTWVNDTLVFALEGGAFNCTGGWRSRTVEIIEDKIHIGTIVWMGYMDTTISILEPASFSNNGLIGVEYLNDTLSIFGSDDDDPYRGLNIKSLPYEGVSQYEHRVKGIGTVSQNRSWFGSWYHSDCLDRLLYFYNGQDTVYKSDDWGKDADVDLDTTYFPLGLDYEWTYQRHRFGWKLNENKDTITIEEYDTFTVNVSDSILQEQTVLFNLSDSGKPFHDLDNPVSFFNGKVLLVLLNSHTHLWASPYSPATNGHISYIGDTLRIYETDEWADWKRYQWTKRMKGLGVVLQSSWFNEYSDSVTTITDNLILFTTPEGQRYP